METRNMRFLERDCVELSNGQMTLRVTRSDGLRIIYLASPGGRNIMAEVPDIEIPPPVGGKPVFKLIGGHRLWYGPEVEGRTYRADYLDSLEITPLADGVRAIQETDPAGMRKTMDIQLASDKPQVTVTQSLENHGQWPVETYPWGLTVVRPGGFAILPQTTEAADLYALTPNRALVLWTYTHIRDPRLVLGDRYILIHANPEISNSLKVGCANRRGWFAYFIDRTLLVKAVEYQEGMEYSDMGCSAEIYTNNRFLELEALAPLTILAPGETTTLTETWTVFSDVDIEATEESVAKAVETLCLDDLG